jgi:uncharacterized membrane protein (DUF485 family)
MNSDPVDWPVMLSNPQFRALVRTRRNTTLALSVVAALYYFSIPALIAWFPAFFTLRITPGLNLGLVFAVSQYPFGGLIAFVFLRRTAAIDRSAHQLREELTLAPLIPLPLGRHTNTLEHAHGR